MSRREGLPFRLAAIGAVGLAIGAFAAGFALRGVGPPPARPAKAFAPPAAAAIPDTPFGREAALGRAIFDDPARYAPRYVGAALKCSNCHLDEGRLANAAPLWAAWVRYPQYRAKTGHVDTFAERLRGCFQYSENGKAPPPGDPVLTALETYAYFLAKGAVVGARMAGGGYPRLAAPPKPPDYVRGQDVYVAQCALCHGYDGAGQAASGRQVFPPLWGGRSYNWGAGMADIATAAGFIKANMPLGLGGSLDDQQAFDVAAFVDGHPRPQDPRFTGDLAQTRRRFHDTPYSLYGLSVNGVILGQEPLKTSSPAGRR